jgi:phage shock protein A
LGRRVVEQDAAVQQLGTSNEQLRAKVDELFTAKQQLELALALATARSSVTAQEPVVASMLERFSATAPGPDLGHAESGRGSRSIS